MPYSQPPDAGYESSWDGSQNSGNEPHSVAKVQTEETTIVTTQRQRRGNSRGPICDLSAPPRMNNGGMNDVRQTMQMMSQLSKNERTLQEQGRNSCYRSADPLPKNETISYSHLDEDGVKTVKSVTAENLYIPCCEIKCKANRSNASTDHFTESVFRLQDKPLDPRNLLKNKRISNNVDPMLNFGLKNTCRWAYYCGKDVFVGPKFRRC